MFAVRFVRILLFEGFGFRRLFVDGEVVVLFVGFDWDESWPFELF